MDVCTGCRQPLRLHSKSRRALQEAANGIRVCNGRCYPDGKKAPQKLSWVAMGEGLTAEEYRERYSEVPPPLEPCPGCGGRLGYHGRFRRHQTRNGELEPLILHRGICRNDACPVVTVTHYPQFVTPYSVFPTAVREEAVRQSGMEKAVGVVAADVRCSERTILRWRQAFRARLGEIASGMGQWVIRLDPNWEIVAVREETIAFALTLCAKVRDLLFRERDVAPLAVARLRPPWPSALPVFT